MSRTLTLPAPSRWSRLWNSGEVNSLSNCRVEKVIPHRVSTVCSITRVYESNPFMLRRWARTALSARAGRGRRRRQIEGLHVGRPSLRGALATRKGGFRNVLCRR